MPKKITATVDSSAYADDMVLQSLNLCRASRHASDHMLGFIAYIRQQKRIHQDREHTNGKKNVACLFQLLEAC